MIGEQFALAFNFSNKSVFTLVQPEIQQIRILFSSYL